MTQSARLATTMMIVLCAGCLIAGCNADRAIDHGPVFNPQFNPNPRLLPVAFLNTVCNGVTTSYDGRTFLVFPHPEGGQGVRLGQLFGHDQVKAYPDLKWNSWKVGDDPRTAFVGANAIRVGPDGKLWLVDTGTPGSGTAVIAGGAKLVAIDLKTDRVSRVIDMTPFLKPHSFLDDIRFNGPRAYLTDAGEPAILVLDLASGRARRVLENDASTTGRRPMVAQGQVLRKPDGSLAVLHADQLEVSPDGQTFYYQPACGPMSKIGAKYLDDPSLSAAEVASHVESFFDTPTTGGTCIDADGNIYVADDDHCQILKLTPAGKCSVVIRDDRLVWADALWIDDRGNLLIPAAQLNRAPVFQKEVDKVQRPVMVWELRIGARALRN